MNSSINVGATQPTLRAGQLEASRAADWKRSVSERFTPPTILALAAVFMAMVIGVIVAQANWIFIAGLAALPLVLFWPVETTLGTFAVLVPFDSVDVISGGKTGTTLTFVVGAATAAVLIFVGAFGGRLRLQWARILCWGGFLAWAMTTILWAIDPSLGIQRLPTAFALLGLYFVASSMQFTKKELTRVILLTILGGVLASAYSAYQYLFLGVTYHHSAVLNRGSLVVGERETDPNGYAANLLLPIALAFGMFLSKRGVILRLASLAALGTMVFALFLTMSRSGLLAFVVVALVFMFKFRLRWRAVLPMILVGGLLLLVPGVFFERLEDAVSTGGAGRTSIWGVALIAIRTYGIFGAGLDNFPNVYNQFVDYASRYMGYGKAPHNVYLGTMVELGIVGLFLLLYAFRNELKNWREIHPGQPFNVSVACLAAALGMLTSGFFLDVLWKKSFWLIWILLAVSTRMQMAEDAEAHL